MVLASSSASVALWARSIEDRQEWLESNAEGLFVGRQRSKGEDGDITGRHQGVRPTGTHDIDNRLLAQGAVETVLGDAGHASVQREDARTLHVAETDRTDCCRELRAA